MIKAIVGANWGDEGKGKITDMFAEQADVVVRFQGGANAGHTIINDYGKFALHLLPSGVFSKKSVNIIGNGVALDIPALIREIGSVIKGGAPEPNLMISDRAQVVMPYHKLFDAYEEERLGGASFGSTKSGIAPFYSDKYAKIGFQVCELYDDELLRERLSRVLEVKNVLLKHLYQKDELDASEIFDLLVSWREQIRPYVSDTGTFLSQAASSGKEILLEGQLGAMRDPDFGIYPFTTSSHTLAGFGAIGAGVPPGDIRSIVAVAKAYSSCVGAGAFVSEIFGDEADTLRNLGGDAGEFGATTGRPRRMGYFDIVATRYGCRAQGATEVALTAIDVLHYMDEIPVCVAYEISGRVTEDFPVTPELKGAKPVIEKLPGFKKDIRGAKSLSELPEEAHSYIEYIEKRIGVPISIVSTGPKRGDVIFRNQ